MAKRRLSDSQKSRIRDVAIETLLTRISESKDDQEFYSELLIKLLEQTGGIENLLDVIGADQEEVVDRLGFDPF